MFVSSAGASGRGVASAPDNTRTGGQSVGTLNERQGTY